jgi:uncharacterized protein (TIGR03905 family)
MLFTFETEGVCAKVISFDIDENHVVTNIAFMGGCPGNLKIVSKLLNGFKAEEIIEKCSGNDCRGKGTSCADQLARAIEEALGNNKKIA